MKRLWLTLTLAATLAGCALLKAPTAIEVDGALTRQVERVISRHDSYVLADDDIGDIMFTEATSQSAALKALVAQSEVERKELGEALAPVADRHDAYVRQDTLLDELERETYLASTEGLRRLAGLKGD